MTDRDWGLMFERKDLFKQPLGARAKSMGPYFLLAIMGAGAAAGANSFSATWGMNDWVQLVYGAIVAFGLTYIGRRQQRTQQAMADLELREKVGVIEGSALRASSRHKSHDPLMCLYVASDARAALHLFPLAQPAAGEDSFHFRNYRKQSASHADCDL